MSRLCQLRANESLQQMELELTILVRAYSEQSSEARQLFDVESVGGRRGEGFDTTSDMVHAWQAILVALRA